MIKNETLVDKGYRELKNAIVSGKFSPGQALPQRMIAEQFGITTITVREILRKLQHDGFIHIEPKWGASVTELGPEQIKGKYLVREALERMSARLIVENATKDDFNILHELADKCDSAFQATQPDRVLTAQIHYDFHISIANASHCKEFVKELKRINLQILMWFNALRTDYTWHRENPNWHKKLVDEFKTRDPLRAEKAISVHIKKGLDAELESIKKHP